MSTWLKVTHERPCPVCKKPDWCNVAADGTVACCMRCESTRPARNGGYIHRLNGRCVNHVVQIAPAKPRMTDAERHKRFDRPARHWHLAALSHVDHMAAQLGVAWWTLQALRVGWDGKAQTWPERSHAGLTVGISRRFPDGRKRCVKGSGRGLSYLDNWLVFSGPVYLVEGGSDTAACMSVGLCVIGRPSNVGGLRYLVPLLRQVPRGRRIIVMGERDQKSDGQWPGKEGAESTGATLAARLFRPVETAMPPGSHKDMREWVRSLDVDINNYLSVVGYGREVWR